MKMDDVRLPDSNDVTGKGIRTRTKDRIIKVANYIRQGNSRTKVLELLEQGEGLSNVQAKRVYGAAIQYLTPTEEEAANLRLEIIETLREVISEGIKKGDKSAVVKALDILNKMSGFYSEKVDVKLSGDFNFGFNFGEENEDEEGQED